jgi:hypothetical protein
MVATSKSPWFHHGFTMVSPFFLQREKPPDFRFTRRLGQVRCINAMGASDWSDPSEPVMVRQDGRRKPWLRVIEIQ